jgi:hypothetical protein
LVGSVGIRENLLGEFSALGSLAGFALAVTIELGRWFLEELGYGSKHNCCGLPDGRVPSVLPNPEFRAIRNLVVKGLSIHGAAVIDQAPDGIVVNRQQFFVGVNRRA